jgi:hypothetical protein
MKNKVSEIQYIARIDELGKDLEEAKAKLTANRFIFRTKVRNEYLDKIQQLEKENEFIKDELKQEETLRETLQEQFAKDQKEITTLKQQLSDKDNTITEQRIACQEFADEYKAMKQQLSEIKYLNRQKVKGILEFYSNYVRMNCGFDDIDETIMNEEQAITAIWNLSIPNQPKLNRQEVKEILGLYYNYYFAQLENIKPLNDSAMNEEQAITAILNLAYDKEKIVIAIEDLNEYFHESGREKLEEEQIDKFANEIIKTLGGNNV